MSPQFEFDSLFQSREKSFLLFSSSLYIHYATACKLLYLASYSLFGPNFEQAFRICIRSLLSVFTALAINPEVAICLDSLEIGLHRYQIKHWFS